MKKIITIIMLIILGVFLFLESRNSKNDEYLRIHIRANSNLEIDQNVKYKVKDEVVNFLIPYLSNCKSKKESIKFLNENKSKIEKVADDVLKENGLNYVSNLKILEEKFPTRAYGNLVLEEGFYDALILNLGTGKGDNWWCVVYPPLCFLNGTDYNNIVFKSKIIEIINSFFKK